MQISAHGEVKLNLLHIKRAHFFGFVNQPTGILLSVVKVQEEEGGLPPPHSPLWGVQEEGGSLALLFHFWHLYWIICRACLHRTGSSFLKDWLEGAFLI